jgi:chain length determinant protein EpsF
MNPFQLLLILRAHYKVALIAFVVTLIAGVGISLTMPKTYVTTTSLVFDVKTPDPVAGLTSSMVPTGYMATQVEIIKSDRVAQLVTVALKLDKNPAVIQDWQKATRGEISIQQWLGERMQRGVSVSQGKGTNIIDITYAAGDPVFAAAAANAFADAYISTNIDLRVDPARQYAHWFGEQVKVMRDNLEKAQTNLSEYQQQNGIVSKDEDTDAETAKLNELYTQLTAAQGQTVDIRSKVRAGGELPPEATQSSLIQALKTDIARQETKLREAGENLGKNHPQYQRMEAELASLKNQLEMEKLNTARDLTVSKSVAMNKESQLIAAINAQKKKLLQLKGGRDELSVLQRDVDAAKVAYDNVVKRYNQTSLESQIDQTNVSVLNPATEPMAPASPDIRKNALVTLLASMLVGAAAALLVEFLDRRIRSVQDLEDMLQVPVLAVLSPPRKQSRLIQLTRQTLMLELK